MESGREGPDVMRTDGNRGAGIAAPRAGAGSQSESAWMISAGRRAPCPVCGFPISAIQGSRAAICENCGFKDGCC
jgi:hypothetical protein